MVLFANILVYFNQSNTAGQLIVLLLLVTSLIAWTVMIGKHLDLRYQRRQNKQFERQLREAPAILQIDGEWADPKQSAYAEMTFQALRAYMRIRDRQHPRANLFTQIENALQRGVTQASIRYDNNMTLLGTIVTAAPFFGLLGTVWGVMDAFGSIAAGGGANIQMLAPGVSGALLTTVAGLLVALPSLFGYNHLLQQIKTLNAEIEVFASSLADRLEIETGL